MMNDLQRMLWKRMIRLIGDYGHGKVDFHRMVEQLEGAMDTGSFRDRELMAGWYEHWVPLDEYDHEAAYEFEFDHEKIHPAVERMRVFLTEKLQVEAADRTSQRLPSHFGHRRTG